MCKCKNWEKTGEKETQYKFKKDDSPKLNDTWRVRNRGGAPSMGGGAKFRSLPLQRAPTSGTRALYKLAR